MKTAMQRACSASLMHKHLFPVRLKIAAFLCFTIAHKTANVCVPAVRAHLDSVVQRNVAENRIIFECEK